MHKYGVSTCIDGDFPISREGELNELRQADTLTMKTRSFRRWLASCLNQRDGVYRESILGGTKLIIVFPTRSAVDNTTEIYN